MQIERLLLRSCCTQIRYFVAEMVMANEYMGSKYPRNRITLCVFLGKVLLMFAEVYLHKPKITLCFHLLLIEVSVGKGSEHWHVPNIKNLQILF